MSMSYIDNEKELYCSPCTHESRVICGVDALNIFFIFLERPGLRRVCLELSSAAVDGGSTFCRFVGGPAFLSTLCPRLFRNRADIRGTEME